jgi:cobalt/nickel transport system permease protein
VRHDFLDRYSRLDSPIHRARPAVKLVATLALVTATAFLPRLAWASLVAVIALLLAAAASSRIPWRFLARRVLWLEPFVLGVASLGLFQPGGLELFPFLLAKSTACLLAMLLLANTTPFAEILRVLRKAHVPALLVTTLSLMYRYLFVLIDEAGRMRRARASRTFEPRRQRTWHTMATVASQLFIRSTERADRIWTAMCARGWQ